MATESDRERDRLRALTSTRLLDAAPEHAFDRLTCLASRLLNAPVALLSLVDEQRQFFMSAFGLKDPWAARRQTPLSHSFCQYVAHDRAPLVVEDAREHPRVRDNPAIRDLDVIAYAGVPVFVAGEAIGSFCVIDDKPHHWSSDELLTLTDLAESVAAEIQLRSALRAVERQAALTDSLIESLGDAVLAIDSNRVFLIANAAARDLFSSNVEVGKPLPPEWTTTYRSKRTDGAPLAPEDGPLARALRNESTSDLEFTLERTGGKDPVWLEASGRAVLDAHGGVTAAVAIYRNVSDRKRQADLYATLVGNLPRGAVYLFDEGLRCLALDGALAREPGSAAAGAVGRTMRAIAGLVPGDPAFDPVDEAYLQTLAGNSVTLDFKHRGRVLSLHTAPVRDALGRVVSGIVLAFDVTTERQTAAALNHSEQVYRGIVQHLPNSGVLMVDRDLRYVAADGPIIETVLRGADLATLVGRTVRDVSSDANRDALVGLYLSVFEGQSRHIEVERANRYYDLEVVPIYEGDMVTHALVFLYDTTDRKAELRELEKAHATLELQARELQEAAVTDALTGLLNRRGFALIAGQQMKVATRERGKLVLFFVDLNGMKGINDTHGHEAGDRALAEVATLLRRCFRASDVIARLGGDEFVVLARDGAGETLRTISTRLASYLAEHNAPPCPFELSLSVGSAVFDPVAPVTLDELIAEADADMYVRKQDFYRASAEFGFARTR